MRNLKGDYILSTDILEYLEQRQLQAADALAVGIDDGWSNEDLQEAAGRYRELKLAIDTVSVPYKKPTVEATDAGLDK